MKIYTNSDSFGSISIKLLVNGGKIMKVIKNCTVLMNSNSNKKCKKCVYNLLCESLENAIEHIKGV